MILFLIFFIIAAFSTSVSEEQVDPYRDCVSLINIYFIGAGIGFLILYAIAMSFVSAEYAYGLGLGIAAVPLGICLLIGYIKNSEEETNKNSTDATSNLSAESQNPKSPYDTSHLRRDYNLQNDFYRSYVRQNTSVKIKKLREIAKQKGDPNADTKFNPDIKYCDRQKRTNGEPLERSVREKYFMAVNDFQELGFYWDHETVKMMYEDDKDIESRMNAARRNREILDENVEELYEKYNKK